MPFWTYMLQCADRSFYVGHTDDLEGRLAQHEQGTFGGYTSDRRPVKLVWCNEFPSRDEALSAERQIKGWSRAKKLALIRDDWEPISRLAKSREAKKRASTSSARTGIHTNSGNTVWLGLGEGQSFLRGPTQARLPLKLHPDSVCDAVHGMEVAISRSEEFVSFHYVALGRIVDLLIPAPTTPGPKDGLWQHTCFEAFVGVPGEATYRELNFSPSGEWAAYRFESYRSGMEAEDVIPPRLHTRTGHDRFELEATLELGAAPLQLALAAVIEEKNGRKSYWALAHPAAKPDFHHPDSFVCELP